MNNADKEYLRLVNLILFNGRRKANRTGTDTFGVFGAQARFNLKEGFPLLTTKKVYHKAIVHELLWFISGSTNIKYLVDNGVNIWNKDAYRRYKESNSPKAGDTSAQGIDSLFTLEEFVEKIKTDEKFASIWGELGEGTYGSVWRGFPARISPIGYQREDEKGSFMEVRGWEVEKVDQLSKAIEKLKTNPDDRRIIVSAWHPYWVDHCVLPPCHVLFHFNTEELTVNERWQILLKKDAEKSGWFRGDATDEILTRSLNDLNIPKRRLNCLMYQRSCDLFLGVPFNIASYALLTEMVAQCVGMVAGEFIHTYGDLHLYENHLEQATEQCNRKPRALPTLKLNPEVKDIFKFKFEDIQVEGYDPHPPIKGEMST